MNHFSLSLGYDRRKNTRMGKEKQRCAICLKLFSSRILHIFGQPFSLMIFCMTSKRQKRKRKKKIVLFIIIK